MKLFMKNIRKVEFLIFVPIIVMVFALPFMNQQGFDYINWFRVANQWVRYTFYIVVFLFNIYVLIPRLLFQKKYRSYILLVLFSIVLITLLINIIHVNGLFDFLRYNLPFDGPRPMPIRKSFIQEQFETIITEFLIVGAGIAYKIFTKWLNEEQLRKEVEKEQLKTNLALLRHQVSPHFFMNTLNNIHALIDINTDDAKDAIIRLSTLMRYLLYDSAQSHISLHKEIDFINSFILLMKLRFSDKVAITIELPEHIPDVQIPPMLFISFLENAFKHGVSYQLKSYIFFKIEIFDNKMMCTVRNSKHENKEVPMGEYSGIGMENIKKSLKLLYDSNYTLKILDADQEFEVNLTIPL
jgi:hypothetical protein